MNVNGSFGTTADEEEEEREREREKGGERESNEVGSNRAKPSRKSSDSFP